MIKEELKQEAEKWLRKFLLCNDCKRKCHCIELNAYCEEQVLKAYIDSAEPREKRIAELTEYNETLMLQIQSLGKENAELKNEWQEQVQKATDEGYARTLQTIQLTKAKELLERLLKTSCNSDVLNLLPNCSEVLRVRVEAEQFLKGDGCPDCFCEDCTKDCGIKKFGLVEVEK